MPDDTSQHLEHFSTQCVSYSNATPLHESRLRAKNEHFVECKQLANLLSNINFFIEDCQMSSHTKGEQQEDSMLLLCSYCTQRQLAAHSFVSPHPSFSSIQSTGSHWSIMNIRMEKHTRR